MQAKRKWSRLGSSIRDEFYAWNTPSGRLQRKALTRAAQFTFNVAAKNIRPRKGAHHRELKPK
jgi:hypothetical protein